MTTQSQPDSAHLRAFGLHHQGPCMICAGADRDSEFDYCRACGYTILPFDNNAAPPQVAPKSSLQLLSETCERLKYPSVPAEPTAPALTGGDALDMASVADFVNTCAREVGSTQTPNANPENIKEAIGRLVDRVRIVAAQQLGAQDARITALSAQVAQEKDHHEFYRGKVSDYMGAEIKWQEAVDRLKSRIAELERDKARLTSELLDSIEESVRQGCPSRLMERDYNGQVNGTMVTDSGAMSLYAQQLRQLAESGRFRIVSEFGRMVVGYWPENDPQKAAMNPKQP